MEESIRERCFNQLGNAVVVQAFEDYRVLLTQYNELIVKMNEIEKFFKSEYFNLYSKLDGKLLLKQIINVYGGLYAEKDS